MNGYLLHGPFDGQFIQVRNTFPDKILRFPVDHDIVEYHLDSVLPMPKPLRGKIATYRFRRIVSKEVSSEQN